MKTALSVIAVVLLMASAAIFAQNNVGIGTDTPDEKLEVSGIIYTNQGGIRFPDETLQETAAFNSMGPGDAAMPYGQVYLTIKTSSPPILDTMRVVDVSAGGTARPMGGIADFRDYVLIKEMDAATPLLFQKCVTGITLTEVRLHFLDAEGELHKTIEIRDALIAEIRHLNVHRKNDEFAHLEELMLTGEKLEIKHFFSNGTTSCYCWDFMSNIACSCN